jgi:hypothetical protein
MIYSYMYLYYTENVIILLNLVDHSDEPITCLHPLCMGLQIGALELIILIFETSYHTNSIDSSIFRRNCVGWINRFFFSLFELCRGRGSGIYFFDEMQNGAIWGHFRVSYDIESSTILMTLIDKNYAVSWKIFSNLFSIGSQIVLSYTQQCLTPKIFLICIVKRVNNF